MDAIAQVIKGQDTLQVFQNEEASQEVKDGLAFTKCLVAVTKHIFPRKHTNHKKMHLPVPDGVTATKISCNEFVDVLEDEISYQWKLEFKKEGFDLSSSTLKEFLD
eukprot:11260733-Ditylum_brightwellii.AAC.1